MIVEDGVDLQLPDNCVLNSDEIIESYIKPAIDVLQNGIIGVKKKITMQIMIIYQDE